MTSRFSRWIAFALVCCLALSAAPTAWALDTWVCPYDQSKNTGKFCPNCGAARPADGISNCPSCNAVLTAQVNFCPECGADLRSYTIIPAEEEAESSILSFIKTTPTPQPTTKATAKPTAKPTAAPTAKPTAKPTATPTAKPTATPKVDAISSIDVDYFVGRGKVQFTWTDRDNAGPYSFIYQYADGDESIQTRWQTGSIQQKSYTTTELIPGHTYNITVRNSNLDSKTIQITVPAAPDYEDGKMRQSSVKLSNSLRTLSTSESDVSKAKKVSSLSAAAMMKNMDTTRYGFRFQIDYPALSKSRYYNTLIAVYAPNGYADSILYEDDIEYKRFNNSKAYLYWYLLGSNFFRSMYEATDTIPSGTYRVELYWDGMYVGQTTFKIDK